MTDLISVEIEKDSKGILTVSSRTIADQLGKEHSKVLKKISELELTKAECDLSDYKDSSGKSNKEYLLNKDGFVLLVMNYQGYNDFKRAYIKRFNEMEKQLVAKIPQTYAEALVEAGKLAMEVERQAKEIGEKDVKLIEQQPKVEFYNDVTGSPDTISMDAVAKIIAIENFGRNKLFSFLRKCKVLMINNQPYQSFVDAGYFRLIEQKWTNQKTGDINISIKTVVYQKGVDYILKLVKKYLETEGVQ